MPKPIITNFIPSSPSPTEEDDGLLVFAAIGQDVVAHNANYRSIGNMPTSRRCKKPDPRGYRKQFSFWLSCGYDWQRDMGEWLMDLKHRRQFAVTIRNALALYRSLQEGRVDLLLDLFPHVKDCLTPPAPPPSTDAQLAAAISKLAQVLQPQQGGAQPAAKPLATLPAPPVDDDDTLVAVRDQDAGKRSCENFVNSMLALQSVGEKRQ